VWSAHDLNYRTADSPVYSGIKATKGKRDYMEDRSFYATWVVPCRNPTIPELWRRYEAYGVLDGHGGSDAVDYVKLWLPWILAQYVSSNLCNAKNNSSLPVAGALGTVIQRAFVALQEQMRAFNDSIPVVESRPFESTGTTVCMLLRNARYAYVTNLGDSRALVCMKGTAKKGTTTQRVWPLTTDHKPNAPKERDRIKGLGGEISADDASATVCRVEPVGLSTSRSLGDLDSRVLPNQRVLPRGTYLVSPVPDVTVLDLSRMQQDGGGYLIFGTDGLWDVVDNAKACQTVFAANNALDAARSLAALATRLGTFDNVTAMVVPVTSAFGKIPLVVRNAITNRKVTLRVK